MSAFLLIVFCSCTYSQQNLSLHKSYQFSEQPNYKLSTNEADKTELTDGLNVRTGSVFWTQQSAVGWQNRQFIEITIDLQTLQPIGAVTLNTAQGEGADVYFPKGVYVFLSNDKQHYYYQGKLALAHTSKGVRGDERGQFQLNSIDKKARYVTFAIYPEGQYRFFFCDEIKVVKSGKNGVALSGQSYLQKQMKSFTDGLQKEEQELVASVKKNQDAGGNMVRSRSTQTIGEQQELQKLRSKFHTPFVVQNSGAWGTISTKYFPSTNRTSLNYSQLVLTGGSVFGAFTLTNAERQARAYTFLSPNGRLRFYKVLNIGNKDGFYIADPLIPVSGTDTLLPGKSQLYLFSINNISNSGRWEWRISSGSYSIKGEASVQVINKPVPKTLNAVNWGYLNYPMLKGIEAKAVSDMRRHHINTFVVPPAVLPNINATDLSRLKDYLNYLPRDGKILLFMNYAQAGNKLGTQRMAFLSTPWKSAFLLWYSKIMTVARSMGFKGSDIYLYPYDEIKNPADIQDFRQMMAWLKPVKPEARFFATILNKAAADALFNYLDIAQFYSGTGLVGKYQNSHTQKWTYAILGASRSLPSYQSYRLMAWQAYRNNVSGIGFWNYAGNKSRTFVSSTFDNYPKDYTVIYNSPSGNIISSRRWEAFKLGLEDYQVIRIYEQYFGRANTLKLVNTVLNSSHDSNKAEEVKQEMLQGIKVKGF
ncbi:MAG TPA: glycoside hydrolase domain-containing protein [Edaphocola sp.]|nr:glycoside hydrolase domain-containing protein [Edaphocola sp.]